MLFVSQEGTTLEPVSVVLKPGRTLDVRVVDPDGKPVAGAVVDGAYQSKRAHFQRVRADSQGTIQIQRSLDPLVLVASTPDHLFAGATRIDAEASEARIVLKPAANASGRLTDSDGKPVAGRKLNYGVRVHNGPTRTSSFSWHFGGTTTTDDAGGFRLTGLVVSESYEISTNDDEGHRIHTAKMKVAPTEATLMALGDVPIDLSQPKPYVPPTPTQLTNRSFAARKEKSPREKRDYVLTEAKREYTRPLLLFGNANDPACVDLFRLFDERSEGFENAKGQPRVKSPADLRWEFELASLDASQPDVMSFARMRNLGVPVGDSHPPCLAVLSEESKLVATYPLQAGADGKLDALALGAFLLEHKPPTRDAEAMLANGLAPGESREPARVPDHVGLVVRPVPVAGTLPHRAQSRAGAALRFCEARRQSRHERPRASRAVRG